MTRFDAIKQMNIEDLAFFLSIIELGDLNSIPNIANEDINYYISYLKEEDNGLIDALHKSNESRHDYKEQKMGMTIDKAITQSIIQLSIWELGCESKAYYSPKAVETLIEIAKKYQKIEQIIKDHDNYRIPGDFLYIDKIREVIEDGNNNGV